MAITLFRRHAASCPHAAKGRDFMKCSCPIWCDGYINGVRTLRKSLGTRDMARARKKAAALESEDRAEKPVEDAVDAFLSHCESNGVRDSSRRKYKASFNYLKSFLKLHGIDSVGDINVTLLDDFRSSRALSPVTSMAELRLMRQFFSYCFDRRWTESNPAKSIKMPRGIKPTDKEPYTASEVAAIVAACDRIGHTKAERIRARAMILTLRYTALRIGDVALMPRNQISAHGTYWRIFLRTEKSGKPVFLPIPKEMKDALDELPAKSETHFFWAGKGSDRTMKGIAQRVLRSVFKKSGVAKAHAHRFRHTLATELLVKGASFEEVADVLGNTPDIVRKYYGKWAEGRQTRIDELMARVHDTAEYTQPKLQRVK
jgi:site-specific recombinase XerD